MELWGNSSNNVVVFTEPDFPYLDAVSPFQPLAMKVFYYPIDTSLSFSQANKLIRDLKPLHLVAPEVYTTPPALQRHRSDLKIEADCPLIAYKRGDVLHIPLQRKYEKIELDPELAASLTPTEVKPGVALATITGTLVVKDNRSHLKPLLEPDGQVPATKKRRHDESRNPTSYTWGSLNIVQFVQKLAKAGIIDVKVEDSSTGFVVHLQTEDTLIQVEEHSTHIYCAGNSKLRPTLRDTLLQCLSKF
ncbi:integrator complex subunit 9-like [Limulus polyphemus]|uniref:Integrator complex subunit 9-like n=1 Tax=Limulus polyphemus TaxID=6850 RepID=A0ABM1BV42_LIMPO|nr:integrator complex subunit 9-like [Limulus polyphemus]XP_022257325.1 integrator complex subunit 9-like [Limulus polyphemus]